MTSLFLFCRIRKGMRKPNDKPKCTYAMRPLRVQWTVGLIDFFKIAPKFTTSCSGSPTKVL